MTLSAAELVHELSDRIPDFPKPGILFRDLTPVFADPDALRAVIDELLARFAGRFDAVAGVEARGFVLAAAAGFSAHVPVQLIRKAGKLPGEVLRESYGLEYGEAAVELRPRQLAPGARVLLLDDLLATGGSCAASARLLERAGYTVAGIGVVVELGALEGRAVLANYDVEAILTEATEEWPPASS